MIRVVSRSPAALAAAACGLRDSEPEARVPYMVIDYNVLKAAYHTSIRVPGPAMISARRRAAAGRYSGYHTPSLGVDVTVARVACAERAPGLYGLYL